MPQRVPSLGKHDAVLLVDVLNDLEFPGGEKVLPWAERLVAPTRRVCAQARKRGVPVIYANDHFGRWRADQNEILKHCTRRAARGAGISQKLRPQRTDYFLLKPRHSAFFATPLAPLLEELGTRRLLIAGIATNLCVLMTAHDARMHGYDVLVLSDCCAAESDFDHNVVLTQLKRFLRVEVCTSDELCEPR